MLESLDSSLTGSVLTDAGASEPLAAQPSVLGPANDPIPPAPLSAARPTPAVVPERADSAAEPEPASSPAPAIRRRAELPTASRNGVVASPRRTLLPGSQAPSATVSGSGTRQREVQRDPVPASMMAGGAAQTRRSGSRDRSSSTSVTSPGRDVGAAVLFTIVCMVAWPVAIITILVGLARGRSGNRSSSRRLVMVGVLGLVPWVVWWLATAIH